jgi:hypothetical protein
MKMEQYLIYGKWAKLTWNIGTNKFENGQNRHKLGQNLEYGLNQLDKLTNSTWKGGLIILENGTNQIGNNF